MATVTVGSARIDEKGNARGGTQGDQTGREVTTQAWYKHELGWNVIRAKDAAARQKIAEAMKAACANNKIGYNQDRRDTLYNAAKPLGFDLSKAAGDTDCSALVRVCLAYAGIMIPASPRFSTYTMLNILKPTGKFDIFTDAAHTTKPDMLLAGDILVTKKTGHTVVVLNDGDAAQGGGGQPIPAAPFDLNNVPTLKFGSVGKAVAYMQFMLAQHGYQLPKSVKAKGDYGYDGEWKTLIKSNCETEKVFREFQRTHADIKGRPLEVDGECGPLSWGALIGKPCK